MRRFLSLLTMFMLVSILAFAQSRVVSGKVIDDKGRPVPLASIIVKSGGGVQADANGEFSIRVKQSDALTVSYAGYETVTVPITGQNVYTIVLNLKDNVIQEVVVTSAFNIKRTARSTSTNVQNVNSEQLNTIRQANLNNALAGKVSGIQVQSQSIAALGRDTKIRLRGENSLGVGPGALYVVDGTIIPSSSDINVDDIDNVSVLQGPAAAAIFGPEGSNGAVIVTTKRGRKQTEGIGLELNSGVSFDKIYILPNYQNSYSGGTDQTFFKFHWVAGMPEGWKALDGKYYHNYDDDASWGPRMAGQEYIPWYAWYAGSEYSFKTAKLTPQPNNAANFYNTGVTMTNNINFSKATDNINFRVSFTNLDIKGLVPNSTMKKNTLNANVSYDATPKLNFSTNITYINQRRNAENDDGYSNQSTGSFNAWFHRDLDMNIMRQLKDLRTPEGIYASWNHSNPEGYNATNPLGFYGGNYWFNFFTYFDLVKNLDERNRLFGDISATYKFSNDFKFKATIRSQQLTTNSSDIYPTELQISATQSTFNPYGLTSAEAALAAYHTGQSFSNKMYYEGLATYTKKIKSFQLNANAGFILHNWKQRTFDANTSGGLATPGVYSLGNSKDPIKNAAGTPITKFENITNYKNRALFLRADLGYKNLAFVEGTFRRDYTSAEPAGNYIDTRSFGASFVFSELLPKNDILSFGKLRGSYGEILNALAPYDLGTYYSNGDPYNGNPTMAEPNTLIDPTLHGAKNVEKEIGTELRFFKNRFGISATYYERKNKDFPVTIATSGATGYSGLRTNAGEVLKKGIELGVTLNPIKTKNFDWNINAAWAYYLKNLVVSITKDSSITRLVSAQGSYGPNSTNPLSAWTVSEMGLPWGQLHGTGIKRNDAGIPIVDSNGIFVSKADVNYGSVLPKYTGGVQNSFNLFKNFVANINIDYSIGGKFFSLSNFWGDFSGLTARTAELNDRGHSVRDDVLDGGGVHVIGVTEGGKNIDKYVDAKTYYGQFYASKISEKSVYDLSYVKLRELSVGYRIPVEKIGAGKYLKGAVFSIIARNPLLIYSLTKDFDPSEISQAQGENGQMPGTRSVGVNLKLNF